MDKKKNEANVLFIDDEKNFTDSIKRSLRGEPYKQYYVNNAKDALKLLETVHISVLITDLKMPDMNGVELLKIIKKKYPEIIRIILTGVTEINSTLSAIHVGETYRYITKPILLNEELRPTIYQAIDLWKIKKKSKEMENLIVEYNKKLKKEKKQVEFFKDIAERSDEKKEMILTKLNNEIKPFVNEIIKICDNADDSETAISTHQNLFEKKQNKYTVDDLRKESNNIIDVLKEVEYLLMKIDFDNVN